MTKLITQLKFQHTLVNARVLGELMAIAIQTHWYRETPLPNLLIPMPLHPKRLKERGFNQAVEIGRAIIKSIPITMNSENCLRNKETAPQTFTPANQRKTNVKKAFLVQQRFSCQHLAVLDDVITTGYTITEFCHALKQAGAGKIDVWCCAKTLVLS